MEGGIRLYRPPPFMHNLTIARLSSIGHMLKQADSKRRRAFREGPLPSSHGAETPIASPLSHLSNAIDVAHSLLCDQPFTGANQLSFDRKVVSTFGTISLGSASSTHRHSPVRLWHMVYVELASCEDCGFSGHASPIGRRAQRGLAAI
jgi:hypothetical protein